MMHPPIVFRRYLILLMGLLSLVLVPVLPGALTQSQSRERCFPETGYCIDGRIREYWEQNGGLPVFGYPISAQQEMTIEGQPIEAQWFERNRLELHPEQSPPYDVLLGRLGVDVLEQQGRDWQTFPRSDPQPDCRYFPETQQNVCGDILAAWQADGLEFDGVPGTSEAESLALFGLPISPLQEETIDGQPYQVQWFERARFELHPEQSPPYHVLLGLLGNEVREGEAPTPPPATTPTPPTPTAPTPTAPMPTPSAPATPVPTPTPTTSLTGSIVFGSGRDGNHEIYRINADGTGETRLTDNDIWDGTPAWSPDGTRIVYASGQYGGETELMVMQADGSNPVRLTHDDRSNLSPMWSPDGTRIAFVSGGTDDDDDDDLYLMQADGSDPVRLTDHPANERNPTWSPDGTRIAFWRNDEIYTIAVDGTGETRLTDNTVFDGYPAWSPDGTRIAFAQGGDVAVMQADGSGVTRLTSNAEGEGAWALAWSPESTHIVFTRNANLYTIRADGTNETQLTTGGGFMPHWGAQPQASQQVGGRLAVSGRIEGNDDIYLLNADGSDLVRLTTHPAGRGPQTTSLPGTRDTKFG